MRSIYHSRWPRSHAHLLPHVKTRAGIHPHTDHDPNRFAGAGQHPQRDTDAQCHRNSTANNDHDPASDQHTIVPG